jgi:hypothetical protein
MNVGYLNMFPKSWLVASLDTEVPRFLDFLSHDLEASPLLKHVY